MLRIAVYYESGLGRNDGNPLYVLAHLKRAQYFCEKKLGKPSSPQVVKYFPVKGGEIQFKDALAEKQAEWILDNQDSEGMRVQHITPTGDLRVWGDYDLHFWIDWGEDGLKGVLPYEPLECPKPMIYWASDTHLGYEYRKEMAKKADLAFCAQKAGVERMRADGITTEWLPHAFEPLAYPHIELASKKYDVCFVGHVNNEKRKDALEALFKAFPNFYYGQRLFEEASQKFAESRIVFNISMLDDLNMRVFEAIGSGSLLLTDDIPTIQDFFKDKKHLVLYTDHKDMIEKARYYLEHASEATRIKEEGMEKALTSHTIFNRVNRILQSCKENILKKEEATV